MNGNRFKLAIFAALVACVAGFESSGQEYISTNRWKVARISLAENPSSALILLEPAGPRRRASNRNHEDEAEARRIELVISKDSPLISWPGKVSVDLSSTNEMQSLMPLLRAYGEVVVVAGRQPGWEADHSLSEFQFKGEIPRPVNSSPDTRKSEAELEAAYSRLQSAGVAYRGALGRPQRFQHQPDGPRAPDILFDAGEDRPWVTLVEPEALLFVLQTISELRAAHQALVDQGAAQKAERERLALTRRRAEELTAESENQKREATQQLATLLESKRDQADKELRAFAENLTELPRAALRTVEDRMSGRPFPAGSERAKLRAQLNERFGDPYAELPARGDPNASRLLLALPAGKGTTSTPGALHEAQDILGKLQAAMAEDEREHTGQLVLLVGVPGTREIQTNAPNRRVSMLKQLLDSDPALTASDRGLAWAVTLLDQARFTPERYLEIQEARRRTVWGFLASEEGRRLCRQIEALHAKMLPELKALHAKGQRAGQMISEAQEDAMQGEEAWKTRLRMRDATKLMLQGEPDSLKQMRVQIQQRLEEFESATRVSYDTARPWVLEKLK